MYGNQRIQITAAIARRLVDLIGVRLATPVAPLAGEGIADIVFRAASLNGLTKTSSFVPTCNMRLSHNRMAMTMIDVAGLADKLGCPFGEDDLKPLEYARAATSEYMRNGKPVRNASGHFSFFGVNLSAKQLIKHRRVAPRSLIKSNHSKAIWHIKALTFDPITHERLLDRCPECQEILDFCRSSGVSHCWYCGPKIDLRDYPQEIVEVDDRDALRFVTSLIDPEMPLDRELLHADLHEIGAGQLFMLCVFIAAVLDAEIQLIGATECFTNVVVSPANLAMAGRAILNWPFGLGSLVAGLSLIQATGGTPYRHPFISRLSKNGNFEQVTIAKANVALSFQQTPSKVVRGASSNAGASANAEAVADAALMELHKYSLRTKSVRNLSKAIGMPRGVLFECFTTGSLPCPDAHLATAINAPLNAAGGYETLVKPCLKRRPFSLPVRSVVSSLCYGEINPWPYILEGLRCGSLPVIQVNSDKWLDSLHVEDFQPWIDFCGGLPTLSDSPEYPIQREEVGFYLDLASASFYVQTSGLVTTLRQLSSFRRNYVSIKEVRSRLLINGHAKTHLEIEILLNRANVPRDLERPLRSRLEAEAFIQRVLGEEATVNQKCWGR